MSDPFNLRRFLDAQASVYANALRELGAGQLTELIGLLSLLN